MSDFRKQAEAVKLARLLHTTPEALSCVADLDADALLALRLSSARHLLDKHQALFSRIAAASKLLPTALVAFIAQRSIGPLLCARIAGAMSTRRSIEIAKHLPPAFMASAAIHLDAERARELTAALPISNVIAVTHELIEQKEFITLGDLVGTLPMSIISPVLQQINDGEALLRSAFFVQDHARLNEMLDALPFPQIKAVIAAAAAESTDLWPHALALMSVVSPGWQQRLVLLAVEGDEATLASMIRGVVKHDLWTVTLPLLQLMPESGRQRLVNLPVLADDGVLRRLLAAAERQNLWQHLLPLTPLMNPALRQRMARLTDELSEASIRHLVNLAHERELWGESLLLVEHMGIVRRATIAELMAESSDEAVTSLLHSVQREQQWQLILPLLATMTEKAQQRFVSLPLFHDSAVQQEILHAADRHRLWTTMLPLLALMPDEVRLSVAHSAEHLDAPALQRWGSNIQEPRHWLLALALMNDMTEVRRAMVAEQFCAQEDVVFHSLLQGLSEGGQWQPLLDLLMTLPAATQQLLLVRSARLKPELRLQLLLAADERGQDMLLQRIAELPASEHGTLQALTLELPAEHQERLRQRCRHLGCTGLI